MGSRRKLARLRARTPSVSVAAALLLALILLSPLPASVTGGGGRWQGSAWCDTPPAIDGQITWSGEWDAASKVSFTLGEIGFTLWIMNDAHFLYVAVLAEDDDLGIYPEGEQDGITIYVDSDFDGEGPEGEDVFGWIGRSGWGLPAGYFDMHTREGSYAMEIDEVQDGVGKASLTPSGIFFEFSKPLQGSSPSEDLQVSYGGRFGFAVRAQIDQYDRGFWPSSTYSEFAIYEVAPPPEGAAQPPVEGQEVTSTGGGHAVAIAFSKERTWTEETDSYTWVVTESDLWVTTEIGEPVTRLRTQPRLHEFSPEATPGGELIVLSGTGASLRNETSYGSLEFWSSIEVYLYEGGAERRLTDNDEADITPTLSPDGTFAVVSRGMPGRGFNLYRVSVDGSQEVRLTSGNHNDLDPSISPDGTKVVFASDRDGSFALYVLDLASGEVSPLLERRCVAGVGPVTAPGMGAETCKDVPLRGIQPAWSPDGRYIAFSGPARDREEKALDLLIYDVESRSVRPVFEIPDADLLNPSWTTDGGIVFEMAVQQVESVEFRVIVGDLEGGALDLGVVSVVSSYRWLSDHPYARVVEDWANSAAPIVLASPHPTAYTPSSPVILSDEVLPDGVEGQPYRHDLGAVGGVPPYSWSLTVTSHDGRLPGWLSFEGGVISSDSPESVRNLTMSVTGTDSMGQSYTGTYRLTIYPATNVRIGGPDYYVTWSGETETVDLTFYWPALGGEAPYEYSYEYWSDYGSRFAVTGSPDSATVTGGDGVLYLTVVDSFGQAWRKSVNFYGLTMFGPEDEEYYLQGAACGLDESSIVSEPYVFEGYPAVLTIRLGPLAGADIGGRRVVRYRSSELSLTVDGRPVRLSSVRREIDGTLLKIHFTVPRGAATSDSQRSVKGTLRVSLSFDSAQVVSKSREIWIHSSKLILPYLYGHHFKNFEVDDISWDVVADVWYW